MRDTRSTLMEQNRRAHLCALLARCPHARICIRANKGTHARESERERYFHEILCDVRRNTVSRLSSDTELARIPFSRRASRAPPTKLANRILFMLIKSALLSRLGSSGCLGFVPVR